MKIQTSQLTQFAPQATPDVISKLAAALEFVTDKYQIDTKRRFNHFITQSCHETQGFTKWVENMYYTTPQQLVNVWPSRFTLDPEVKAKAYAPDYIRNQEKLANLVYANRMGNGDANSGEGFKYRGSGGFHLTGKYDFARCSQDLYGDDRLVTNPELVRYVQVGMETAGWYWNSRKLNDLADADAFTKETIVINNSDKTVPERLLVLKRANTIFTF